ncbi:MAG TPA: metal ABC transporter ATP-binding protein [Patescibacteria group bacterium]|nr:metal ABC transporter ATP-binding protein [Patescibacteria group bacterium]
MMKSPIIEAKNISFDYEGRSILNDASLEIYPGDFMAIIGPNGSGKSTLMKICTGLIKPRKGSVTLFGKDINKFKEWGRIGYIPQKATSFNQDFPATVEEVVKANLYSRIGLMGRINKQHIEKVHEVLDLVGMLDFKDRLIGKMSGGQQQRVFIAKALVSSPEILFMDEPTTGIDANSEKDFYALMDDLNKEQNITIVMVTHDIGAVSKNISRVICLSRGKAHEHGCGVDMASLNELYGHDVAPLIHNH